MFNRVVIFGCSHAYGSEIEAPGIITSKKCVELGFGNQIAQHFKIPVKISARPGGSNRQIFINAVEHTQPGDLCILAWTYFSRENWFARTNHDTVLSDIFNEYHVNESIFLSENPRYATSERINSGGHQFIKDFQNADIQSFVKTQQTYYQHETTQALNFLQIFISTNAVVKQLGGIPLNFHFDCDDKILNLINKKRHWPSDLLFKNELYDEFSLPDILLTMPKSNQTRLFSEYTNNVDMIRFYDNAETETSFKRWICQKLYNKSDGWPNGRHGHLGLTEHTELAKIIIERLEA
jgi:hypothetical protein